MANLRKVTVLIDGDEYRRVKIKAAEDDVPVSEVVRELLARWLTGEIVLQRESDKGPPGPK